MQSKYYMVHDADTYSPFCLSQKLDLLEYKVDSDFTNRHEDFGLIAVL